MKPCPYCKAVVEDNFDVCWNCNYSFEEKKVVEFKNLELTGSIRFVSLSRMRKSRVFLPNV